MNYYSKKEVLKEKAFEHTKYVQKRFSNEIRYSIEHSSIIEGIHSVTIPNPRRKTKILLTNNDTVSEIFNASERDRICVLNFASYKNPGGQFMNGSSAQEESLCHRSILYNVLSSFEKDYYEPHKKTLNKALYTDTMIYSEDVLFFADKNKSLGIIGEADYDRCRVVDVMTCAAPNSKAAINYKMVHPEETYRAMEERIMFIMNSALNKSDRIDTLILGAFGCGVFGNSPLLVAKIFEEYCNACDGYFDKIIFAIPKSNTFPDMNHDAFEFEKEIKINEE